MSAGRHAVVAQRDFPELYPHANGQYGLEKMGRELHPPLRTQTIPALLKKADSRTGIIGKLHVGPANTFPFDQRLRADMRDVRAAAKSAGEFLGAGDQPFFLMANYAGPHVLGPDPRPPKEAFPTQYKGVPEKPLRVGEVPPFPFNSSTRPSKSSA